MSAWGEARIGPRALPASPKCTTLPAAGRRPRHLGRKGTRMNILIGVLITFLVVILVLYLVNMLPIDGRAKQIVQIIVIVIGIISLLKYLAVF
jgi:hypothetical protein